MLRSVVVKEQKKKEIVAQKEDRVCVWYCGSGCGCGLKKVVL
jgi:hypothetical protein